MLPRVILQNAVSLDSRIDWIDPDLGLYYEVAGKMKFDAHLAGSNTILDSHEEIPEEDDKDFIKPRIDKKDNRAILVVPDSSGRIRTWHYLRRSGYWRHFIALCSGSTPKRYLDYLKKRHIDYIITGKKKVNMTSALEVLYKKYNVRSILMDSGGTLNGIMLREGLVTDISVLIQPQLVGGTTPKTFFRSKDLSSEAGVIKLKLIRMEKLKGSVVWLRYKVIN